MHNHLVMLKHGALRPGTQVRYAPVIECRILRQDWTGYDRSKAHSRLGLDSRLGLELETRTQVVGKHAEYESCKSGLEVLTRQIPIMETYSEIISILSQTKHINWDSI
jgi:hypothetical protein